MSKPLARVGQRFTAQFIDDLVALAIGGAIYVACKALALPLDLAIVGALLYLLLCDGLPGGRSIGKRLTGIAVVQVDTGEPCGYWRSLARNSAMALGVLDAALIAGKQRRRLGDYVGGTKVIQLEELK
jgi:uncharacterized RDD family membrane protein YckC